jgi:oligopeptide transport system permease protein
MTLISVSPSLSKIKPSFPWYDIWIRLSKNKLAVCGFVFFVFITLACFLGPLFFSVSYQDQNLTQVTLPPSIEHWMGTDILGRDLFIRLLYGGRISISVGFAATLVSLVIGMFYGSIAGYLGGTVDIILMRIIDILYALPFTIFVILLMVIFGRNIILLFITIGAVEWLTMARIVRSQVMSIKQQDYISAAIALGLKRSRIIMRHIFPNILGPVIVYSTLTIPSVMLLEAILSFLGLGIQPPMSSWGVLIKDGSEVMEVYPWMLFFPALFFSLTLFALNFLGDGLRDALDPKSCID